MKKPEDNIVWLHHCFLFSLKKTVMKIRPQVSGPTDVGFGNYILTAPVDRGARQAKQVAEVINVDELLSDINTLTNPNVRKNRQRTEF